jgi:hypothetical protein
MLQCTEISQRNDVKGQNLPRHPTERAAAMAPITDTKADDWGGCRDEAFLIALNIAKLPSVPRQILKASHGRQIRPAGMIGSLFQPTQPLIVPVTIS